MSTGAPYVKPWQRGVGWLDESVPFNTSDEPLWDVALKLEYHMHQATRFWEFGGPPNPPVLMEQGFYKMPSTRGGHGCNLSKPSCKVSMSGDFGFGTWCFPAGIQHYIRTHRFLPPKEFLEDLKKLPDPPPGWDHKSRWPHYE